MYIQISEGLGQPASPACKPEPGEVAASRTAAGILTKDVEITDKGVLVTDFGIERRSVKGGAKSELASLIRQLETDPSITKIRIHGYSDCIGPGGARYHTWLRRERARRVRDLLGPGARAKVKFVGPAPLDTNNGPNTDRAGRARNRSVLIEFDREITFEPEKPIEASPCHEQLIRRALRQMRDDQSMDGKIKSRLSAALGNSLTGHDDSFIRPLGASISDPIGISWMSIKHFFSEVCNRPGGAKGIPNIELDALLRSLDRQITQGVVKLRTAAGKVHGHHKGIVDNHRARLDALLKNKAKSVYAEY